VILSDLLNENKALIEGNRLIKDQIGFLYDQLLEKNIIKLIKPYSKVEMNYLARKLGVSEEVVEKKIGKMILDKVISGSMDQERGILLLLEREDNNSMYLDSLEIIGNMDECLSGLFERAKKIKSI